MVSARKLRMARPRFNQLSDFEEEPSKEVGHSMRKRILERIMTLDESSKEVKIEILNMISNF
ncbi:hypothetical protein RchiOBHm_Chr5g0064941 [Rosa chinensis]|uniref:Uncharacterized protein n=1 Tax=Rosa chinensis TaxID=74649 RepID=A0A2P6QIT3_ROSCH|nr:hypothetical protein RchiOBHm_Chr5g0064941 [Rosa chinensis]